MYYIGLIISLEYQRMKNKNAQMNKQMQQTEIHAKVYFINIDQNQDGQRIDNFLLRQLKGVPKSRIYRLLRKGEVRVNKGRIKPDYKLKLDDVVRIPPVRVAQSLDQTLAIPTWLGKIIKQPIFEDEALLVINKPSGLAVHGGSGIAYGLIEAMRELRDDLPFLELAHRIDRETSGCVILAKSRKSLIHLHQQFSRVEGRVEKSYLAIVSGELEKVEMVQHALQVSRDSKGMKRVIIATDGQTAKSTFIPIQSVDHEILGAATYVRIQLETGRMHQARVHAASIDRPIIGDKLYGDWQLNRRMKPNGIKRCMLHAERYSLTHPDSGKLVQFTADVPQDFKRFIDLDRGHP